MYNYQFYIKNWLAYLITQIYEQCHRSVMVKSLDYWIVVSEFELQLLYFIQYQINALAKNINPFILPAMS